MEKGTIVYLDGIKCHMGEIDHQTTIDGEEYYIMSSVNIEGCYYVNNTNESTDNGTFDIEWAYPVKCCSEASEEDAAYYNAHQHENC